MHSRIDALVRQVDQARLDRNLSPWKVAQAAGVSVDAVRRFLHGYHGEDERIRDQEGPGRVRLDTALRIAEACGVTFEVREAETASGESSHGGKAVRIA